MPLNQYTLLYVEDEEFTRTMMVNFLEDEFKHIYTAENGEKALELLESNTVDIIMSDIEMPEMDGLELSKAVKEKFPYVPVILLTAYEDAHYLKESINASVDQYFVKPIESLEDVCTKAHSLIQKYHLLRDNEEASKNLKQKIKSSKSELLSEIAHQWRQPLSAVSSLLMNIQVEMELNDEQSRYFDRLTNAQMYLSELSRTLDSLSEVMLQDESVRKINSQDLFQSLQTLCRSRYNSTDISFSLSEDSIESFSSKELLVKEVLYTVLQNSFDAFDESDATEKSIMLDIQERDNTIEFMVQDNAGGILPEMIQKLFEPYTSSKSKNKRGLGLYIVWNIVTRLLEGAIEAHNVENGACICVRVPKN